ncbi:DUF1292 domain-containing protein [Candidatus Amarolinea aalborgensis]|uniref:DUF1292 domain-containing protein n=1 Tax=Candidatus Amarolinea aalborgensis TaxID=2249329 RepID=UPI003BF95B64
MNNNHNHDHDHDHEHDEDEEGVEIIVLSDEDGNEEEFALVEVITVADQNYAVLTPLDDEEGDETDDEGDSVADESPLMILRIEQEDGEEILVEIEDTDEFERVVAAWEEQTE